METSVVFLFFFTHRKLHELSIPAPASACVGACIQFDARRTHYLRVLRAKYARVNTPGMQRDDYVGLANVMFDTNSHMRQTMRSDQQALKHLL